MIKVETVETEASKKEEALAIDGYPFAGLCDALWDALPDIMPLYGDEEEVADEEE